MFVGWLLNVRLLWLVGWLLMLKLAAWLLMLPPTSLSDPLPLAAKVCLIDPPPLEPLLQKSILKRKVLKTVKSTNLGDWLMGSTEGPAKDM